MIAVEPLAPDDVEGCGAHVKAADEGLIAALSMQGERHGTTLETIDGRRRPGVRVTPAGPSTATPTRPRIYLDIHGGGLIVGGGEACQVMAKRDRRVVGRPDVVGRLPDAARPPVSGGARRLRGRLPRTCSRSSSPDSIVVGGGSAGGNLAAALMLRARDEGLPLPAALVLLTPELDLTESGDSFQTNMGVDNVLTSSLADRSRSTPAATT